MVEFALVIPIFLLLLVAIFDLGRAVFAYNTLTNAAREGARMAAVNQDQASIVLRAKNSTSIVELNDPSVTVGYFQENADGSRGAACPLPGTTSIAVGCLAVVSFEATYQPITPLISNIVFKNGVTFTAQSVFSVEYSCPTALMAAASCPKQP
jgi:Flp pilus assembly protein TadG